MDLQPMRSSKQLSHLSPRPGWLQSQMVGRYPELSGKQARERRIFALLMCLRHQRSYLKPFSKRLREKICFSPGAAAES